MKRRVLVVDDDPLQAKQIASFVKDIRRVNPLWLAEVVLEIETMTHVHEVVDRLAYGPAWDVILADLFMPEKLGDVPSASHGAMQVYRAIEAAAWNQGVDAAGIRPKLVVMSNRLSERTATRELRGPREAQRELAIRGACWAVFLPKTERAPLVGLSDPQLTPHTQWGVLIREAIGLCQEPGWMHPGPREALSKLLGTSAAMALVRADIERCSSEYLVCIQGETGTGKKLVAQALHEASRRGGEFVTVNCGGRNQDLLDVEIRGHDKGAFTGAQSARAGALASARNGTLYLDEFGSTDISMLEASLRHVLDPRDRTYTVEGNATRQKFEGHIILGSSQLERLRHEASDDLRGRLSLANTIQISPLRERPEDVLVLLADFMVAEAARVYKPGAEALDRVRAHVLDPPTAVTKLLADCAWVGNARAVEDFAKLYSHLHGQNLEPALVAQVIAMDARLQGSREPTTEELETAYSELGSNAKVGRKFFPTLESEAARKRVARARKSEQ